MIRIIHNAGLLAFVACIGVSAALNGCASAPEAANSDADSVGSIGLDLQVGGATLDQVSYTIVGPNGLRQIRHAQPGEQQHSERGALWSPRGNGYTISLNGTSVDGGTTCAGSSSFDVHAHQTAVVSVHLLCHQSATTGSVQVGGTFNVALSSTASWRAQRSSGRQHHRARRVGTR
ncbi:MAG: hypothetical protein WDO69_12885 [Pseudomonadota bacterium]